jgi:dephospho-CoA kinase
MTIGLTGGIGSGKSTVASIFELLGAAVFDSDAEAKHCYYIPQVKEKVIHLLGAEAYSSNGKIDRNYIANLIFGNQELLQKINAIIHPAVKKRMQSFELQHHNKLIVKESALLFEAQLENTVDKIVVVTAPLDLRIKRSVQRDGVSRKQVEDRIAKQVSQEEKIKKADFVIDNSEQILLLPQVIALYHTLTK